MIYNTAPAVYTISHSAHVDAYGEALIDSVSNGGLAGKEMQIDTICVESHLGQLGP
jgi:hypothetical protein